MIPQTYNKRKQFDPRWWLLIAFVLLVFIVNWCNVSGQYIELSQDNNSCNEYKEFYVTIDFDKPVHSVSFDIYWNDIFEYISLNLNDCWYTPMASMVHNCYSISGRNHLFISWIDVFNALPYDDTLFSVTIRRTTNINDVNIYFGTSEITDHNSVPYPVTFIDGWLRCLTSGIKESEFEYQESVKHYDRNLRQVVILYQRKIYNINGKYIKKQVIWNQQ